ncbi:hypothetical protein HDU85_003632 [Gaertneriomyces sp. JEL0708]|nr:hypothetical protein HDU85_003632 [Gaertneriomyces sp. JEL0708]
MRVSTVVQSLSSELAQRSRRRRALNSFRKTLQKNASVLRKTIPWSLGDSDRFEEDDSLRDWVLNVIVEDNHGTEGNANALMKHLVAHHVYSITDVVGCWIAFRLKEKNHSWITDTAAYGLEWEVKCILRRIDQTNDYDDTLHDFMCYYAMEKLPHRGSRTNEVNMAYFFIFLANYGCSSMKELIRMVTDPDAHKQIWAKQLQAVGMMDVLLFLMTVLGRGKLSAPQTFVAQMRHFRLQSQYTRSKVFDSLSTIACQVERISLK